MQLVHTSQPYLLSLNAASFDVPLTYSGDLKEDQTNWDTVINTTLTTTYIFLGLSYQNKDLAVPI